MTTVETKNNKALMLTILLIAFIQMGHLAIMPGIDRIESEAFPERSLQEVQTVMSLPNAVALITGIAAALLVRYGLISKKTMVLAGIIFIALTGVSALAFNSQFWHLYLMNSFLGAGMGVYIPSTQSIMFDSFEGKKLQFLSGMQVAISNVGGIVMSVVAGLLITIVWYGGHTVMLVALPIAVMALFTIPKDEKIRPSSKNGGKITKIPGGIYYITILIFVYMIVYNVAGMNISTHIANGDIGDAATAGVASALMMAGGVVAGLLFPKVSQILRDNIFPLSLIFLFIGFTLMNLFPSSLAATLAAMAICGISLSLYMPRCIFNAAKHTDPTNSATATLLISCIAPASGSFLSPVIVTNLTILLGGDSTRFRYQFTAFVCLVLASLTFAKSYRDSKKHKGGM